MVISHGEDEKVLRYNACRELEDELFDKSDVIKISEIVEIFSEKKCMALRQTLKMFFFNCCQISKSDIKILFNNFNDFIKFIHLKTCDALKPTADVMLPVIKMILGLVLQSIHYWYYNTI
jgi:hypothetical protein